MLGWYELRVLLAGLFACRGWSIDDAVAAADELLAELDKTLPGLRDYLGGFEIDED